jgi:DNA primase
MSVVDEVKQRVDIVDIVGQYTSLTKAGKNLKALCPFHSETRPSFYVYPEQQSWHCFGACSTGGDVFSFVMKKEGLSFGETLQMLAQRAGVTIPTRAGSDARNEEKERLYRINEAAAQYFHNLLQNSPEAARTRDYLNSRSLTSKTIADFQLGYSLNSWEALKGYLKEKGYTEDGILEAGLIVAADDGKTHDRFRNRLIFPIKDARGRAIGFGARVLDDSLPKYLNSPQTPLFDKSGTLYAINLASPAIRQQGLAVVVEGYMDAITAHQNGFNNVIAAMGIALTERQVTALKRLTRNMVLALDADAAGDEASLRAVAYENILDAEVRVLLLPRGKDPDDVIREDAESWRHLLEQAAPIVDFAFDISTAQLDLATARGKSEAAERLFPIVAGINDSIRQAHYLTKISRITGTPYRNMENAFQAHLTQQKAKPKTKPVARTTQRLFASRLEEDCLALLLQHPELRDLAQDLLPDYFENSESRELLLAWQEAPDPTTLKEALDPSLHEYIDLLANKSLPPSLPESRYNSYLLGLQERYLRNLMERKAQVLEAEGDTADREKIQQEVMDSSLKLLEIFNQRARRVPEQRR